MSWVVLMSRVVLMSWVVLMGEELLMEVAGEWDLDGFREEEATLDAMGISLT